MNLMRYLSRLWIPILAACGNRATTTEPSAKAAATATVLEAPSEGPTAVVVSTAKVAEAAVVPIPEGRFSLGSTPGDRGRNGVMEPSMLAIDLGAFDIDRMPYPNEADKPALVNVDREKATELCKAKGRRLCTEVEWERACKGPDESPYAGNSGWDVGCESTPSRCASGFGVVGMGGPIREWTSSDAAEVKELVAGGAVVRGAPKGAADVDHRCARRGLTSASSKSDDLGFRCCGGPPNAATVPAPIWKQTFGRAEMPAASLADLFETVPQLRKLGRDLKYFAPEAAKDIASRSDAGDVPKGVDLTTLPLLWNPIPGEEFLLATGLAGDSAFIVAFHKLPDDRYRVGSTLILKGDRGPVVFGTSSYEGRAVSEGKRIRPRVDWATCWKCPGESGFVTYRDDGRVVITQE